MRASRGSKSTIFLPGCTNLCKMQSQWGAVALRTAPLRSILPGPPMLNWVRSDSVRADQAEAAQSAGQDRSHPPRGTKNLFPIVHRRCHRELVIKSVAGVASMLPCSEPVQLNSNVICRIRKDHENRQSWHRSGTRARLPSPALCTPTACGLQSQKLHRGLHRAACGAASQLPMRPRAASVGRHDARAPRSDKFRAVALLSSTAVLDVQLSSIRRTCVPRSYSRTY